MARSPRLHTHPNITPLVDVLLVLIIIFLLSVRLTQEGIDVSLPSAGRAPERTLPHDREVVLEYSADRKISLNKEEVSRSELGSRLREIYRARTDKTMWLLGAGTLRYGDIVDVIDTAKGAGVERVGVITPEMRKR
jgi:biopolymer transport protein TolR